MSTFTYRLTGGAVRDGPSAAHADVLRQGVGDLLHLRPSLPQTR
jgi:hypothetical protein